MTPWDWDEKGCFWFNRDTGEEITPQELWIKYQTLQERIRRMAVVLDSIKSILFIDDAADTMNMEK